MGFRLLQGDCLEVLRTLDAESVDSIVADPPYELGFMGKAWDASGIAYNVELWREALRVLKPGGHLLAFGGSRTYHRLACAVEDAGFEIRDQIQWIYGSGFPKSKNLDGDWQGWGTALKPAHEPIVVARKRLAGTVAENVLRFGTGAINVDACRVGDEIVGWGGGAAGGNTWNEENCGLAKGGEARPVVGRWPANLIHDGSDEVVAAFPRATGQKAHGADAEGGGLFGKFSERGPAGAPRADAGTAARFFYCAKASKADRDEGLDALADRVLARSCQAQAEAERGNIVEAEGGAFNKARIRKNNHPTVKPTALMRYLVRLVTPPGGLVLDPFNGSGSTGKAAVLEGFEYLGIDREAEYIEIASARIAHAETAPREEPKPAPESDAPDLYFGRAAE